MHVRDDSQGREAMGNRGREWVLKNATREALAAKYLDHLLALVGRGSEKASKSANGHSRQGAGRYVWPWP